MKKLFLIGLLLLFWGMLYATQSIADRYEASSVVLKNTKTVVITDTVVHNDTMWCTELNISKFPGEFYSIGYDIDAISAGTIAGEILIRQGNEKGNLQVYTTLVTLSTEVDMSKTITTDVEPMTWLQLGVTNTDNSASIEVDYLSITKTE